MVYFTTAMQMNWDGMQIYFFCEPTEYSTLKSKAIACIADIAG